MLPAAAGGGRRRPEVAGDGRPKLQAQAKEGASVVKMEKWSFAKGVSESEAIARWKEYDEERKMAWSLVAKVEYVVVERVEKVVVEMGYFGGKRRKKMVLWLMLWWLLLLEWRKWRGCLLYTSPSPRDS